MADNFDLKKFLKENKALENLNPSVKALNENKYYKDAEADDAEHIDALEKDMKDDKKSSMKSKIKEYILAELGRDSDYDYEEEDVYGDYDDEEKTYYPSVSDLEDEPMDYELDEAKKKDKEEDVEDVEDVEMTDTETEDVPAEDAPDVAGGLEDIAANMEGTENDLMKHLMDALKIAKGLSNEKLETQIGNTLKFFVSEYIGGGEQ